MATEKVYVGNTAVQVTPEMAWIFDTSKEAQEKREKFVDDFFGFSELEKKYGIKFNKEAKS